MTKYNFSTLNSSDLEDLACELLNAENKRLQNGIFYRTFKAGKDRGIDFRYATEQNENLIIGQVKHYLESGTKLLFSDLKNKELPKVIKLAPSRYLIVTSLSLSVSDVDTIYEIFSPYIKSKQDIYGREALNQLLELHPDVLDNHFKLWFSSTAVLKRIVAFEQLGRSQEFTTAYLTKKIRIYVQTPSFGMARRLLNKYQVLIITGEPGAGKTTLAELLLYEFLKDSYQLTYILDDIKDVEKTIKPDDSRQLYYFDDFLGHNSAEIQKLRAAETALLYIVKRIQRYPNKLLVMTTRKFIFNEALAQSQRMTDQEFGNFEFIVDLKHYSKDQKLQLFRNHVEVSKLQPKMKRIAGTPEIENFIINHKNFSPRSVEYITTASRVSKLDCNHYEKYIRDNFNAPDEIWREAYEQQISEYDRILLNTIFSLGDHATFKKIEKAFEARLRYHRENHQSATPLYAFKISFRRLTKGFIDKDYSKYGKVFKFSNNSLVDFLYKYFLNEPEEVKYIIKSALYLNQLYSRFYPLLGSETRYKTTTELKDRLAFGKFEKTSNKDHQRLFLVIMRYKYDLNKITVGHICAELASIRNFGDACVDDYAFSQLELFLEGVNHPLLIETIQKIGTKIFEPLFYPDIISEYVVELCQLIKIRFAVDPAPLFKMHRTDYEANIVDELMEQMEAEFDNADDDIDLPFIIEKYQKRISELQSFGIQVNRHVPNLNSRFISPQDFRNLLNEQDPDDLSFFKI
ncbi:ATP-binding protein [Mucilaginibacter ginsenosidivorax]|uniref:ATP-binding protein n=1 Tax=Mucilaginibacter ginsenosidivorax TaxID=862126 RepID=A0A5B8W2S2_9SPHI|nr:ATP-binding protein [Mucilaginibacter ginsenosidivorax]QEC77285.1 ATP-binding protein [Mucilaginibacter ginsenosidivorax]